MADDPTLSLTLADPHAAGPAAATGATTVRYVLEEEIARGGMGVVFRATDAVFGREVAVKVLQAQFAPTSGAARRFADEARITGQLQHPAIPPVHDVGTLPDSRPFLAMKLIRGRTLHALLEERPDPAHALPRFLAVFEQVCQAVAYAHAHAIIHRDLKPSNVMVGAFGEVQVMDWGLAKELGTAESPAKPLRVVMAAPSGADPERTTDFREAEEPTDDHTQVGQAVGTPAYMPPEQARGELDRVDRRSDVFALGGLLCAVLTGKPPYTGGGAAGVMQKATAADLADARSRIDACRADAELVALCQRCLAADPDERPADATAVAALVAGYRAGVERRLREAEQQRAAAEAKTVEQRKRRKVQLLLAAAVGLLLLGGGAFAWWQNDQARAKRTAILQRQLEDEQQAAAETARLGRNAEAVGGLLTQIKAALRAGDMPRAGALLDEALKRAAEGGADDLLPRIADYRAELTFLRDIDIAERLRWNSTSAFRRYTEEPAIRRQAALRAFGADPDQADTAAVAQRVAGAAVRDQLVAALDRQLVWHRGGERLRKALRAIDPDPYRDALRDAVVRDDQASVAELAADARAFDQPGWFIAVLGDASAVPVTRRHELLKAAVARDPDDLLLLMALGGLFPIYTSRTLDERPIWFQAAVSVAPTNSAAWNNLGATLMDWRELARAEAALHEAIRLDPTDSAARGNLGSVLVRRGDLAGAEAAFREALRLNPNDPLLHSNLSGLLQLKGDLPAAVAACREAIRRDPKFAPAHANLGVMLLDQGKLREAEAALRKALELEPNYAHAHLGLGNVLLDQGATNRAEAEYRTAIRLNPRLPDAHFNLGVVLRGKKKLAEAEAAHREAIRIDPNHAPAHNGLGNALRDQGDLPGAIAAFREAIRIRPKFAFAHNNLGIALAMKGDLEEAIAAFEESLQIDPNGPGTQANLDRARKMKADRDARRKPREPAPPPRPASGK